MKYRFELSARPRQEQSIEDKHKCLVDGISQVLPPWAWVHAPPPAPDPKGNLVADVNLGKHLGKGIQGHAYYQYRRNFRGESYEDDLVEFACLPSRFDYKHFLHNTFPTYVTAFDAYLGQIQPDELIDHDLDALRKLAFDPRKMIHRIFPASFFDAALCRQALKMSPSEVVARLNGHVEAVRILNDGVLIILTSEFLPLDKLDNLSKETRHLLS